MKKTDIISFGITILFLAIVVNLISESNISKNIVKTNEITINNIGLSLFNTYLLPFEILAILLTAGVIGAIILLFKTKI